MAVEGGVARLCVMPAQGGDGNPRCVSVELGALGAAGKLRRSLGELGFRPQAGNPAHVVVRSEEVLLSVREFPTGDEAEARVMAEGVFAAMPELEPDEHILGFQILERGTAKSRCLLAVFARARVEPALEILVQLGVSEVVFAVDFLMDRSGKEHLGGDGWWGEAVKEPARGMVVLKAVKVAGGKVVEVQQRFAARVEAEPMWLQEVAHEWMRETGEKEGVPPAFAWETLERKEFSESRLGEYAKQIAEGRAMEVPLRPAFWQERVRKQKMRRGVRRTLLGLVVAYLALLVGLAAWSFWQVREGRKLENVVGGQETAFRTAMDVKRELAATKASLNPAGSALEVLRQVVEPMPEGMVMENYTFRWREGVKIRGTAATGEMVYDYVARLRANALFRSAKADSVGTSPERGGVTWQVAIPLQHLPSP